MACLFRVARARVLALLSLLLGFGAGVFSVSGLAQEVSASIGFLAPQSGSNRERGISMVNGAQLAIDELNKKNIKVNNAKVNFQLIVQDDRFNANTGKLGAHYLLKRNVLAVVCHSSTVCIAAADVFQAAHIPQISVGATSHQFTQLGYNNVFRMLGHSDQGGILFGQYAYRYLRLYSIAVIDDKTPSGTTMADQFSDGFKKAGGVIAGRYSVSDKTSDFNEVLAYIKEKKVDAIFWGGTHLQAANMIVSAKRLGLATRFLNAMNGMNNQNVLNLVNDTGNILSLESDQPRDKLVKWKSFEKAYIESFQGSYIDVSALRAYDAIQVLGEAIKSANSLEPQKLAETLHAEKFKGLTGPIEFDAEGNLKQPVFTVYESQGSEWKVVKVVKAD